MDNAPILKIKKMEGAVLPQYESPAAAAMDIRAFVKEDIVIPPMGRVRLPTGLFFEIPPGYEVQIRSRSGLAFNHGVSVLNSPGTIDSDYRGEIGIILVNLGSEPYTVKNSDRIAQMLISPIVRPKIIESDSLSDTERGLGGFGSTGVE